MPGPRPTPPAAPTAQPAADGHAAWGRVAPDGTVFVRTGSGERAVGQYPGKDPAEALAYFSRKYEDLAAQVALLEQRVRAGAAAADLRATAERLAGEVSGAAAVGDLDGLTARIARASQGIDDVAAAQKQDQDRARAEALARREAVVAEAEQIAGQDPARIQWKHSGDRMTALFDDWKAQQRATPRLARAEEEALWKRFRTARGTFDRKRRAHFSELDVHNAEVKAVKEGLVARAEQLSGSTEWRETQHELHALMDQWKAAGRGGKKSDDTLWARFRAAQDAFFQARKAANDAVDAEFEANLQVKLALLERAETLVPVTDLARAKAELRRIGEAWDEAGKVPRARFREVEDRFRAVERAVREAEDAQWRRTNPETRARAAGLTAQLEDGLARLEGRLAEAEAHGDDAAARQLREDLEAKRALLSTVRRASSELA